MWKVQKVLKSLSLNRIVWQIVDYLFNHAFHLSWCLKLFFIWFVSRNWTHHFLFFCTFHLKMCKSLIFPLMNELKEARTPIIQLILASLVAFSASPDVFHGMWANGLCHWKWNEFQQRATKKDRMRDFVGRWVEGESRHMACDNINNL